VRVGEGTELWQVYKAAQDGCSASVGFLVMNINGGLFLQHHPQGLGSKSRQVTSQSEGCPYSLKEQALTQIDRLKLNMCNGESH